jgi:GNAT superfamily N-acetyltransferase
MKALAKQPPAPPKIRAATEADVLAMAKVHIISWRETYPGMLPEPMLARMSIAVEAIRWQRTLDRPRRWGGTVALVAEQDGAVVGYGSCGEQRTRLLYDRGFTAEVGELYVLKSAQRLGAGSGLMKAMAGALVHRGHCAMSLWVLEQNSAARRFYERVGGTPIARKSRALAEIAYAWSDLEHLSRRPD